MSHEHDHGLATAVDVEAEATRGLRGLGGLLLVVGALCLSGGLWMLLGTSAATGAARAVALLEEGRAEQALALAERAVADAPQDAEGWLVHGRCLLELGRATEALASLERACDLDPAAWRARLELARAHAAAGDAAAARAALDEARALAPGEPAVEALARELER